ncbi:MAG: PRD domain-containing protein [Solobacterium sp.]|nr:PRD domain-containing protein [Solobacterium sp.]
MIIKKIVNNNVVVSSNDNDEIIVIGKGIGFNGKVGEEINPNLIEKTYVLQDVAEENSFQTLLGEIPYEVIEFGIKATEYISNNLNKKINKRILIPLTDHIYSSLQRYKDGVQFDNNLSLNVSHIYKDEYKIAKDIVQMMNEEFNVEIGNEEATFITLHILNAEMNIDLKDTYTATNIIDMSVSTVEKFFNVKLDTESINFARFVNHLQFFAERMIKNTYLEDDLGDIVNKQMRYQYPKQYACAKEIGKKIEEEYNWQVAENEYTYLTIHIVRLLK